MKLRSGGMTFEMKRAGNPRHPLVLLLHGFPQTSYSWRHQLEPLADAGYFAVAPDQRGYSAGARPQTVDAYATDALVGDALAMMDVLGHHRAHVVGHDWGGQLAWLLSAHHPERVLTLTVLSRPHPRAFLEAIRTDAAQAERSKHHRAFQDPATAARLLADGARRLRALFGGEQVPAADQEAYLRVLGEPAALDAAINWYRAAPTAGAHSPLAAANTPTVTVPTLYVWGDADATVGRAAAEGTARWVTGDYRFEALPGIGHFITDQVGEKVTELLLAHLARHADG
jgi:pimeloyl-ACP methyl ester carboxylesterase